MIQNDPWFQGKDWQEFAQAIYSPIVQRGLSKILMSNLPIGALGTVEQEALRGAFNKGFNTFYKELIKLTVLPNIPQERQMPRLEPDPLQPEEPQL